MKAFMMERDCRESTAGRKDYLHEQRLRLFIHGYIFGGSSQKERSIRGDMGKNRNLIIPEQIFNRLIAMTIVFSSA